MCRRGRVRDGDGWILDGQKVWTSGAEHSDFAACLARTNPERTKRDGITMFVVDMHDPGVSVRPLRQMTGDSHFSEVFLDGVSVPVGNVIGAVDDGWRVARTMLAFERKALGGMGSGGGGRGGITALVSEARAAIYVATRDPSAAGGSPHPADGPPSPCGPSGGESARGRWLGW